MGQGWVHTGRSKNDGAVGNTLEDLLEIPENNLSIANTLDWELKAQRKNTAALTTLFHLDPYPRKPKTVVARYLLPNYGWKHQRAGGDQPVGEMSFRATLSSRFSDRGFRIKVDSIGRKVELDFNPSKTDIKHKDWLDMVKRKVGSAPLEPVPFWDFDKLHKKCVGKIKNTIFILAAARKTNGQEEFKYEKLILLEDFAFNNFVRAIMNNFVFVDFDARTGHNHGTKFRISQRNWAVLFNKVTVLKDCDPKTKIIKAT